MSSTQCKLKLKDANDKIKSNIHTLNLTILLTFLKPNHACFTHLLSSHYAHCNILKCLDSVNLHPHVSQDLAPLFVHLHLIAASHLYHLVACGLSPPSLRSNTDSRRNHHHWLHIEMSPTFTIGFTLTLPRSGLAPPHPCTWPHAESPSGNDIAITNSFAL